MVVKKHAKAHTKFFYSCPVLLDYSILFRDCRLRNIFLKEKFLESKKVYSKQRNICVKMVKKAKKEHFQNINLSEITDYKKFWKTVSPLFGNQLGN